MIEDKQVEVWRKEFESGKSESATQRDYREPDLYWNDPVQHQWEGFCIAKRSMQPIELPKPYIDYDEDDNACKYWTKKQINDAITAAGYSYRVKE